MTQRWGRHHAECLVGAGEAQERVRAAFPDAHVVAVDPLSAGVGNTTVRVTLHGTPSPLVLRLYTADPAGCAREVAVLGALPRLVLTPSVLHAEPDATPPWALLSWIDGGQLDRMLKLVRPAEAQMLVGDFGATLAAIQSVGFSRSGFLASDLSIGSSLGTWSGILGAALQGRAGERLGTNVCAALEAYVARHSTEMDRLFAGEAVLCHGDYGPRHLLARRSPGAVRRSRAAGLTNWSASTPGNVEFDGPDRPRLAAIVGWESVFAGPALFDVGTFFRDERLAQPHLRDAFAEGYCRLGGRLPDNWPTMARRVDLLSLCRLIDRGDKRTVAAAQRQLEATLRLD